MVWRNRENTVSPGRLVTLAASLMFFYGCLLGGMQLVIAEVAAYYNAGTSGIGFLVSAQHLTAVLMPVAMGSVADRFGKKRVLVSFTAVFAAGCFLSGVSQHLGSYLLGTCLIGAGYSVCESLSSAALTDLGGECGMRYVNLTQCLLSVGAIVSPVALRYAMERWGCDWRLIFLICAGSFLLLAALLMGTSFPAPQKERDPVKCSFPHSAALLCLMTAIILYVGLENGFGYFVETHFSQTLHSAEFAAIGISAYWAGMALSRFLCSIRSYHARTMLLICFAASGVLFAGMALWKNKMGAVLLCGLIGLAFGPIWSTLVACAAGAHPQQAGTAIGMMNAGCGLGGVLYPPLIGVVASHISLTAAFFILAITAISAGILCLRVRIQA